MATDKQIHANRANAMKSTGPRTEAGKRASSRNALRHGLTAEHVVLDNEDPADFDALRASVRVEFEPQGPTEAFLVDRLAGLIWRLNRVPGFEAGLITWMAHLESEAHDTGGVVFADLYFTGDQRALPAPQARAGPGAQVRHQSRVVGRALEAMLSTTDPLGKLARYEGQLMRELGRTLAEVRTLQAERGAPKQGQRRTCAIDGAAPDALPLSDGARDQSSTASARCW